MSRFIICFCIIISTGYGLVYNKIRNIKDNNNSMWIYYTNISNLIVLIYFNILIISWITNNILLKSIINNSIIQYTIMMIITITMLIYHFLLRNNMKEKEEDSKLFKIQNRCLHYITPILTIIYWIVYSNGKDITYLSCLYWVVIPLIYFIIIMIRANFIKIEDNKKKYPYHFLEKDILGNKRFCTNIFVILFTFILISEIIYMLIKVLK